jgi:membrane dipeptidase
MNRVGLAIDMSHSSERSTLEAIEHSARPIAVTHANPASWHSVPRNKSDRVLKALAKSGGMLGFSLCPHHLHGGSACTPEEFCAMVARPSQYCRGIEGGKFQRWRYRQGDGGTWLRFFDASFGPAKA